MDGTFKPISRTTSIFIHWKARFAAAFPTHATEGDVSKSLIASLANLGVPRWAGYVVRWQKEHSSILVLHTTRKTFAVALHSFSLLPFQIVVSYRLPSSHSPRLGYSPTNTGVVRYGWPKLSCCEASKEWAVRPSKTENVFRNETKGFQIFKWSYTANVPATCVNWPRNDIEMIVDISTLTDCCQI